MIKVDVDLVNVLCSVRNKNNGLVGNLEKSDFKLFEDGKEMEIKYFTRETDLPLTIGMLVDTSKSQENLIEPESRAAYEFFKVVLRKKDMAFLMQFGAEAEIVAGRHQFGEDASGRPAAAAPQRARRRPASGSGADATELGGNDSVRRRVPGGE